MRYLWIVAIAVILIIMLAVTLKGFEECWDKDPKITLYSFYVIHPFISEFWIWGLGTLGCLLFLYSFLQWVFWMIGG